MAKVTIVFGGILILLGLLAYFVLAGEDPSMTALIPAVVGIPLALVGAAAMKDAWRKHATHLAAVIGLLGLAGSLSRIIPKLLQDEVVSFNTAVTVQLLMAAICLVFLVVCVRSFISARRSAG